MVDKNALVLVNYISVLFGLVTSGVILYVNAQYQNTIFGLFCGVGSIVTWILIGITMWIKLGQSITLDKLLPAMLLFAVTVLTNMVLWAHLFLIGIVYLLEPTLWNVLQNIPGNVKIALGIYMVFWILIFASIYFTVVWAGRLFEHYLSKSIVMQPFAPGENLMSYVQKSVGVEDTSSAFLLKDHVPLLTPLREDVELREVRVEPSSDREDYENYNDDDDDDEE